MLKNHWIKALGAGFVVGALVVAPVRAQGTKEGGGYLRIESGLSGFAYNTLQNPKNGDGTRFSLLPLLGTANKPFGRVTFEKPTDRNHGVRFIVSLLRQTGTGILPANVQYRGKTFASGQPTDALYQFHSYRVSYWSRVHKDAHGEARAGLTLNIRDARIHLAQAGVSDNQTNVGLVPLAYLAIDRKLAPRWMGYAEADVFAVSLGRAEDVNLRLGYALNPKTELLLGIRTLEGGVDRKNDIYNFTRYNFITLGIGLRL